MRTWFLSTLLLLLSVTADAATVQGSVRDRTGGALPGTFLRLLSIATGDEQMVVADANGRFEFANIRVGIYRLATSLPGFSDVSRTLVLDNEEQALAIDFDLELGSVRSEITVSAARGGRDVDVIPLRTDALTADRIRELAPANTGEALLVAPGVTPVGSGPFQVRPRVRGLDSTRVLVLVDGERLNNARTATDRAGVEVGLVDPTTIQTIEVLGGAGSVLYGTDALAGTINIITNRPQFSEVRRLTAGFDGFFSSNEDGGRAAVTVGVSDRRWAVSFIGGAETYDEYSAGGDFDEGSTTSLTTGTITHADVVDSSFGFNFGRFPDPFNAPFERTSAVIPNSGMKGSSANLAATAVLSATQTLDFTYQRRRAEDVGFPDFAQPFFFQAISLPWSRLDKVSATYRASSLTPWLSSLLATTYFQRQDRLLRNQFPVIAPIPSATFLPIQVYRIDIQSDTRQQVWTPGLDVQATILTRPTNVLTVGATVFRDRSEDERTTTSVMTQIGQVAGGPFGPPSATVFDPPLASGEPSTAHPVRVPNASFRDIGIFAQDEWNVAPGVRLTGGLRVDNYDVTTSPTPGYDVTAIVAGAQPPIDPATLPDVNGDRITRTAFTGEAGVTFWSDRPVQAFAHYVRSYRHPNLEELLFSGPATAGSIAPNITVEPETGHNVDVGARLRLPRFTGSIAYFNNTYRDFISTEVVALVNSRSGPSSVSQAINLARVRIQGIEAQADVPFVAGDLIWLPQTTVAFNYGTVLEGTIPLSGESLAGAPQDNITPLKMTVGLRVSDRRARWWASYYARMAAKVTRVSPLLSDSPFLIPQDLFALDGFVVQRVAFGFDWRPNDDRLGITAAIDNLTNAFYREQFQFAPAKGRSFTVTLTVRGRS